MVRETKHCCHCGKTKPLSDFWKDGSRDDGFHHNCKDCGNELAKKSYKKSRESHGNSYIPRVHRTAEEQHEIQLKRTRAYRKQKKLENPNWKKIKEMAYKVGKTFEEVEQWFNAQWMKQQAQCAICGKVFSDSDCIDHDHNTNQLRGLLCSSCNVGIGMLCDSPDLCIKASRYLTKN